MCGILAEMPKNGTGATNDQDLVAQAIPVGHFTIVTQTTLSMDDAAQIVAALKADSPASTARRRATSAT